jgi:glycosyltransferase involved in cell wall biosynthesis
VEVIVVDGESDDSTVYAATRMGAKVIEERKRGYGRALKTGWMYESNGMIAPNGAFVD